VAQKALTVTGQVLGNLQAQDPEAERSRHSILERVEGCLTVLMIMMIIIIITVVVVTIKQHHHYYNNNHNHHHHIITIKSLTTTTKMTMTTVMTSQRRTWSVSSCSLRQKSWRGRSTRSYPNGFSSWLPISSIPIQNQDTQMLDDRLGTNPQHSIRNQDTRPSDRAPDASRAQYVYAAPSQREESRPIRYSTDSVLHTTVVHQ
jgi:cell division protein FtsL